MEQQIRTLTARLLASRSLPRTDPQVRRADFKRLLHFYPLFPKFSRSL